MTLSFIFDLTGGVTAQDPEVVTGTMAPVFALELARGDGDTMTSEGTGKKH